jgi:hypothetical protein
VCFAHAIKTDVVPRSKIHLKFNGLSLARRLAEGGAGAISRTFTE